ncbi:MAG: hypothetical protein AB7P69_13460 [Candidatus Binatia bacterium]
MKQQHYPAGWNEDRVRKLLQHYEAQTEDEAVAEDEAAFRRRDQTVMVVPTHLVSTITKMIAREGKRKQSLARRPNKGGAPDRSPVAIRKKPERARSSRGE